MTQPRSQKSSQPCDISVAFILRKWFFKKIGQHRNQITYTQVFGFFNNTPLTYFTIHTRQPVISSNMAPPHPPQKLLLLEVSKKTHVSTAISKKKTGESFFVTRQPSRSHWKMCLILAPCSRASWKRKYPLWRVVGELNPNDFHRKWPWTRYHLSRQGVSSSFHLRVMS